MSFKIPCGGFMLGEGLVLSEDGKTLNVSGGGGSGSGQFIVTVYNKGASGASGYEADKTYDEIKAAIDSGAMVLVHYKIGKNASSYKVFYNTSVDDDGTYVFTRVAPELDGYIYFYTIAIYEENGEMVINRDRYKVQSAAQA